MSKTYETGHAKNVANFQKLIEFVTDYGNLYNPAKTSLKPNALIALQSQAKTALEEVIAKNTHYNNAVNTRIEEFSDLRTLSTRLVNALQATDATPETIKDANGFNKKIQGKRASTPQTPTDPNTPAPQTISASQTSYDQLIQHFTGLKSVLENEPSYTPNEVELQVATLETKISNMTSKNTAVAKTYAAVSSTRIARDKILYIGESNLVDTATEVKKYIKSVFGAGSPEFDQVESLAFRKILKKKIN